LVYIPFHPYHSKCFHTNITTTTYTPLNLIQTNLNNLTPLNSTHRPSLYQSLHTTNFHPSPRRITNTRQNASLHPLHHSPSPHTRRPHTTHLPALLLQDIARPHRLPSRRAAPLLTLSRDPREGGLGPANQARRRRSIIVRLNPLPLTLYRRECCRRRRMC
jgi:hypothetical protein